MKKFLMALGMALLISSGAKAAIDVYEFDTPIEEQRYRALVDELRCPKCQNQNLADSDAEVAKDLRHRTWQLIREGRSDGEIRDYLVDRYGDFITYRPPVRSSTALLWFGPFVLLFLVVVTLLWRIRRKAVQPVTPLSDEEKRRLASLLDDTHTSS